LFTLLAATLFALPVCSPAQTAHNLRLPGAAGSAGCQARGATASRPLRYVDPNIFAQRVTDDMASVAHDGHLYLDYDPSKYAALWRRLEATRAWKRTMVRSRCDGTAG
jgi:hypothetical protein